MKYPTQKPIALPAKVALFTRAWIEMTLVACEQLSRTVALFTRAWIEIAVDGEVIYDGEVSPSSRGRGLK